MSVSRQSAPELIAGQGGSVQAADTPSVSALGSPGAETAFSHSGPNPAGLCMCGCGGQTNIAGQSRTERSAVKGTPLRFIKGHNRNTCLPSDMSDTKRCSFCGETYPRTNEFFYRHSRRIDGCASWCKECKRAEAREKQKCERARAYDFVRLHSPEHRAKLLARSALRGAIRYGNVTRPTTCQDCGTECTPHGHHEDYAKPLEVEWLCSSCHGIRHRKFDVSEV